MRVGFVLQARKRDRDSEDWKQKRLLHTKGAGVFRDYSVFWLKNGNQRNGFGTISVGILVGALVGVGPLVASRTSENCEIRRAAVAFPHYPLGGGASQLAAG